MLQPKDHCGTGSSGKKFKGKFSFPKALCFFTFHPYNLKMLSLLPQQFFFKTLQVISMCMHILVAFFLFAFFYVCVKNE